jgi:hypothetical protein
MRGGRLAGRFMPPIPWSAATGRKDIIVRTVRCEEGFGYSSSL